MKKSITLLELDQLLNNSKEVTIIDVRSAEEFKERHIPFAVNIPIEKIISNELHFDSNKIIVTTCGSGGGRSDRAAAFIRENNKVESFFLEGGTFGYFENFKL